MKASSSGQAARGCMCVNSSDPSRRLRERPLEAGLYQRESAVCSMSYTEKERCRHEEGCAEIGKEASTEGCGRGMAQAAARAEARPKQLQQGERQPGRVENGGGGKRPVSVEKAAASVPADVRKMEERQSVGRGNMCRSSKDEGKMKRGRGQGRTHEAIKRLISMEEQEHNRWNERQGSGQENQGARRTATFETNEEKTGRIARKEQGEGGIVLVKGTELCL
eukprot:6210792-Pleurochrysis_carterae.AAC.1